MRLAMFCSTLALGLSGCGTVGDGFVTREWSKKMRELGIYPLFPPREDVYVGDVYVIDAVEVDRSARSKEFVPIGNLLLKIDLLTALKGHYGGRQDFPATGGSPGANGIFEPPATQMRLKTVAFPNFLRVTATGADVAALVPIDAFSVKAGIGINSVKSASITVASAESYGVPWSIIGAALGASNAPYSLPPFADAASEPARRMTALLKTTPGSVVSDGKADRLVDVTVISEVFYARTFDVTMHMSSDAALSAVANLAAATDTGKTASTAAKTASVAASQAAGATPANAIAVAAEARTAADIAGAEAAKLTEVLDRVRSQTPQAPGVTAGLSISATGDVGLRRTYDRPIAIGFRGARYRVNLSTGHVTPGRPSDSALSNPDTSGLDEKN